MSKLPSKTLKSVLSRLFLIHIVDPNDNTQHATGSSFRATLGSVLSLVHGTSIVTTAGTNQATAFELTAYDNAIDTTDGVKGCKLNSNDVDYRVKVRNNDQVNDLFVYPKLGGEIYYNGVGLGTNMPLTVNAGNAFEFVIYEINKVRAFNVQ